MIIWEILEEAAEDDYLPVVQCLFAAHRGYSRWALSKLRSSSNKIFQLFVNRIQAKVLDHQTSLEARSWAWNNIDYQHCNSEMLIAKAQQICFQFDKDSNTLWESAFKKILLSYQLNKM